MSFDEKYIKMRRKKWGVKRGKRRSWKTGLVLLNLLYQFCCKLAGSQVSHGWKTEIIPKVKYMNVQGNRQVDAKGTMSAGRTWKLAINWKDAHWLKKQALLSNKERNKNIRSINGNGGNRILRSHIGTWVLGFGTGKLMILKPSSLIKTQTFFFISEANIMAETVEEQRHITGYSLVLPNTMEVLGYARITLLVKQDIEFKVLSQYMEPGTSSIWISVGSRGRRPLRIGGIYREQHLIRQGPNNNSGDPNLQIARWDRQLAGWTAAAAGNANCIVIGDLNLDFLNWDQQAYHNARMVERTKTEVETLGFSQLVVGITRSCVGQEDSTVDHIWSNNVDRVVSSMIAHADI